MVVEGVPRKVYIEFNDEDIKRLKEGKPFIKLTEYGNITGDMIGE
jgi:hypothetical protein